MELVFLLQFSCVWFQHNHLVNFFQVAYVNNSLSVQCITANTQQQATIEKKLKLNILSSKTGLELFIICNDFNEVRTVSFRESCKIHLLKDSTQKQ